MVIYCASRALAKLRSNGVGKALAGASSSHQSRRGVKGFPITDVGLEVPREERRFASLLRTSKLRYLWRYFDKIEVFVVSELSG